MKQPTYNELVKIAVRLQERADYTLNDSKRGPANAADRGQRLHSMMEWNGTDWMVASHTADMAAGITHYLADFAQQLADEPMDSPAWDKAAQEITLYVARECLRDIFAGVNSGSTGMQAASQSARIEAAKTVGAYLGVFNSLYGGFDEADLQAVLADRARRAEEAEAARLQVPKSIALVKTKGEFSLVMSNHIGEWLKTMKLPGVTTRREARFQAADYIERNGLKNVEVV